MKSTSKYKHQGSIHLSLIVRLAIIIIGILGYVYYGNFVEPRPAKSQLQCGRDVDCSELDGPTYVVSGQVTRKQTSCSSEVLGSDGIARRGGGICDGGNSLEVEGIQVSTGGGALESQPPKYISDIESIHAGDRVEVRYAKDKFGYASTNCESCYIKKI